MPEVHELRDALPNGQPNPITSVAVLAQRFNAPQGYDVGHVENVVVDVKLVGDRETLPVGFVAVQDTLDTKEPVFQKKRLCVKLIPRDSTDTAVCDLRVTSKSRYAPAYCTLLGELNGMSLWIRWRKLPPIVRQTQASTAMTHSAWEGMSFVQNPSLPYSPQPDASTQGQLIYSVSAMEGIPFVLHERFGGPRNDTSQYMILDVPHKTFTQIETEYDYDFLTERSVAAHQAPSQD
uniref:multivesicular body subunit 12B-like isoform X2 n=1 Tax=Myxine glutinosa TaxID=7769 RepID=UPI00358EE410